jgi:hypothetical protein
VHDGLDAVHCCVDPLACGQVAGHDLDAVPGFATLPAEDPDVAAGTSEERCDEAPQRVRASREQDGCRHGFSVRTDRKCGSRSHRSGSGGLRGWHRATEECDVADERDWLMERFEERRTRLRGVAYRMLGSVSEADDAVQEV